MRVPVDKIVVPDERARARYSEEQKAYLRASLGKYGQLSDILVRPLEGGLYELIDGESRLRELAEGGALEVEVKVLELDDRDSALVNILMNVARGEQDPMGVALSLGKALEAGMSEEEMAAATGHAVEWVRFMVGLLKLPDVYQNALQEGRLLVTHIRQALRLPSLDEIDAALTTALRLRWNTSVLGHYVDNRLDDYRKKMASSSTHTPPPPPPEAERERLANYRQCLGCLRMVNAQDVAILTICGECTQLLRYVTSQMGTGKEAMDSIYKAVSVYQDFLRYKEREATFAVMEKDRSPGELRAPSEEGATEERPRGAPAPPSGTS